MSQPSPFTPAETRLLPLLGEGLTNAQIGRQLHLSELTVKSHLRRIRRKLRVNGTPALVAELYRRGHLAVLPVTDPAAARPALLAPPAGRAFFLAPGCAAPHPALTRTVAVIQPDEDHIALLGDIWAASTGTRVEDTYRTEANR